MKKNDIRLDIGWLKQIKKLPLERLFSISVFVPVVLMLAENWMMKKAYFQEFLTRFNNIVIFFFFFFGSLSGLIVVLMGEYPVRFPIHIKGKPAVFIGLVVFVLGQAFAYLALYNILR